MYVDERPNLLTFAHAVDAFDCQVFELKFLEKGVIVDGLEDATDDYN